MLYADQLPLLPDDTHLSLRIFLDGTVAEAYWQGGRVAMTIPSSAVDSVSISTDAGAAQLINATSWSMGSVYTTVEDVLGRA